MKNSKVFIYGGGNLLQDNTSTRSLFYYLSTVWLAKILHLKVMFYANGIGPLKNPTNRILTKKILDRVDVITLREELSFEELKILDIAKPKILLTSDAALTITDSFDDTDTGILEHLGIQGHRPLLGISLRKYPGHEKVEHEKYESVIAQAVDHMASKYGAYPVFFPMQHPNDVPILENVAAKMKSQSYIVKERLDIVRTLDLISETYMVLGMRLHSLVFASVAAVPMVGLEYDPKIQGFLDCIGQPSAGDVRNLDYDHLVELMENVWQNREAISQQLEEAIPSLKEKARENARVAVELISSVTESD
ncbi:MAG: polysaccharide pyruvyl transferase CsaB [Syntrophomonadaceae bacterium]|nr:polysaccharide pyruvyl transferase CsaB [Syntrophomonadaceae bacterium]